MTIAPTFAPRTPRAARDAATGADGGAADAPATDDAAQARLAARQRAFDEQMATQAEDRREAEALESLMLEQLKFEDAIMKKWIAMID